MGISNNNDWIKIADRKLEDLPVNQIVLVYHEIDPEYIWEDFVVMKHSQIVDGEEITDLELTLTATHYKFKDGDSAEA